MDDAEPLSHLADSQHGLNRVAAPDTLYTLADLLHHARTLMTKHNGFGCPVPVVVEVYIGMADACGNDAHQDFIVSWTFQLKGLDPQGPPLLRRTAA